MVDGAYSASQCGSKCVEAGSTDVRGFSYDDGKARCACFFENNSDVIARCDAGFFSKCASNKSGSGPVVRTSSNRQEWKCYG
eukprot:scaffold24218_cov113-Cylindrotheca_fusiformis.AAC.1